MNRKFLLIAAALLASLSSVPACATGGLYLGAGVGSAATRQDVSTGEYDKTYPAFKGFVGYRFDEIPIVDLGLEGGYTDFGNPSQTIGGQEVKFKLHGAYAAGLLIFPIGPLDLYGKGGVYNWSSELNVGGATTSRSGNDPLYGAGIGFYVWKIGIRAEYERYQIKDVDRVHLFTINALFQF